MWKSSRVGGLDATGDLGNAPDGIDMGDSLDMGDWFCAGDSFDVDGDNDGEDGSLDAGAVLTVGAPVGRLALELFREMAVLGDPPPEKKGSGGGASLEGDRTSDFLPRVDERRRRGVCAPADCGEGTEVVVGLAEDGRLGLLLLLLLLLLVVMPLVEVLLTMVVAVVVGGFVRLGAPKLALSMFLPGGGHEGSGGAVAADTCGLCTASAPGEGSAFAGASPRT